MNRQSVNRAQIAELPWRQCLYLGFALMLTLAAGQFCYSWQTARLAQQVATQTALLMQIQATHGNTLVKATTPLPAAKASTAPLDTVVAHQRWVF